MILIITVSLAVVQEMCARMGAVTGKGLSELIREQFGIRWTLFATTAVLVANVGIGFSEFIGIGAAMELLPASRRRSPCRSPRSALAAGGARLVQGRWSGCSC